MPKRLSLTLLSLVLTVHGTIAEVTVTPDSLSLALDAGNRTQTPLDVTNTGSSAVEWTIVISQDVPVASIGSLSSGVDAFGYRWADSSEPFGPVFEWVDVSEVGTPLFLADDDGALVNLPFEFVFYGVPYHSVRVSSNGYLTFGPDASDHTNDPIPTAGAPNALIAPYWADLDPTLGGSITTFLDSATERFIVQYTEIQPFGGGQEMTFQVALHRNGDVYFYYQSGAGIGTLANNVTIGIENDTGTAGASVAYNSQYASSGLAVRFNSPTWLTALPLSGSLAPGETASITIGLNAGALHDGLHTGTITLIPAGANTIDVPVELSVSGQPIITVNPTTLIFPAVGIGGRTERFLDLSNDGTAVLIIEAIDFSDSDFSTDRSLPVSIEPGNTERLALVYSPRAIGPVDVAISVVSNDPARPGSNINLIAEGIAPADIAVAPSSLSIILPAGDTAELALDISNLGIAALNWNTILNGDVPVANQSRERPEPDFSRPFAENRIIVRFKEDSGLSASDRSRASNRRTSLAESVGASNRHRFKTLRNLEVWELRGKPTGRAARAASSYAGKGELRTRALIKWLQGRPEVDYAEPDYLIQLDPTDSSSTPLSASATSSESGRYPHDPSFGQLWGLHNTGQDGGIEDADIDAPEAWAFQTSAAEVIVAVIDTGVDYDHPDIAANMWVNPGEIPGNGLDDDDNGYIDDIHGWNFSAHNRDPKDDHNHGTHCAGTIAAVGDNGVGVTGVAWRARIMALKFLNSSGSGLSSDAIGAIDYAVANGARVSNNSWGGGGYSQALRDTIEAAARKEMLFVAASGNNSDNAELIPAYPAAYSLDNIISVAATTRGDTLASFSNYGSVSVDLGAPGHQILSTTKDNTYSIFNGTSMASPHVAGAAAMILGKNPLLTAAQVKQILLDSSDPIPALNGKTVSGGRLNLRRALDLASPPWFTVDQTSGTIDPGEQQTVAVRVDANFLPTGTLEGTLTIFSNDPDEGVVEIPLTLTVTASAGLLTEPSVLSFGEVFLGSQSALDLELVNSGTEPLSITGARTEGAFSFEASFPIVLEAGERATLPVTAKGLSLGASTGLLTIESNDPTDPFFTVPLHASVVEPPAISRIPARLDVALFSGAAETLSLPLANTGSHLLEFAFVGDRPPWLQIGPSVGNLPPGTSTDIDVRVNATGMSAGQYATRVYLESNDPLLASQPYLVVLQVSDGPVLHLDPVELDFLDVYLGYPRQLPVTLTNVGNTDLEIVSTSTQGAGFELLAPWSGTLAPGASRQVSIRANPSATRSLLGALIIESNDGSRPRASLPLSMNAREIPNIALLPTSFSFSLQEGESRTASLEIQNDGLEPLEIALLIEPEGSGNAFGEILQTFNITPVLGDETLTGAEYARDRFFVTGANLGPNIPQIYVLDAEGNYERQFSMPGVPAGSYGAIDLAWDGNFLYGGGSAGVVQFDTTGNYITTIPKPDEFARVYGVAYDPGNDHFWINGYAGDILEINRDGDILRRFSHSFEGTFGLAWDDVSPGGPYLWVSEIAELQTRRLHQFNPQTGAFTGLSLSVNPAHGWNAGLAFTTEWRQGQATLVAFTQSNGDAIHLINIGDVQGWLNLDNYALSVPPGESGQVQLAIDSTGVLGGSHLAQIKVNSNDPDQPLINVPVNLQVSGIPVIELATSSALFDRAVFVGSQAVEGFRIRNAGTDRLTISSLIVTGEAFSLEDSSSFSLSPQESRELKIRFSPSTIGASSGSLEILSHAPGQSAITVELAGTGVAAPVVQVDTTPIHLSLYAGEEFSFPLSIANSGDSTLVWRSNPHDSLLPSASLIETSGSNLLPFQGDGEFKEEDGAPLRLSAEPVLPDPKALPWSDGFESGRWVDDWLDPYGTGKASVSTATASEGVYAFHYYGQTESAHLKGIYQMFEPSHPDYFSFRVRADSPTEASAYVTLSSSSNKQRVMLFFNTGTGFWHQTEFPAGNASVPCTAGQWYRIECRDIDWSSRTFDYYVDGELIERDIRFNSSNVAYVDRLDLYNFSEETSAWWDDLRLSSNTAEWMQLSTASGETAPAGDAITLVTASADYLSVGVYEGYIMVRSNDPANPEVAVPVTMQVKSAPSLYLPGTSVDFGDVVQASSGHRNLVLSNSGTEAVTITALSFSGSAFSSPQNLPLVLQPGERHLLQLVFQPSSVTSATETLTLVSDSPVATPTVTLVGRGVAPPDISAETSAIVVSLPAGQSSSGTFTIENLGTGPLQVEAFFYTDAVRGGGSASAGWETNNAGGPDNFGYTFRDEREPDGPLFQWEEIALPEGGSGTEIASLKGFRYRPDSADNDTAYEYGFDLPFPFSFYGTEYTQFAIGAFGVVYFEDEGFGWYTPSLPNDLVASGRGTNRFIGTYIEKFNIEPGGIYLRTSEEKVIVEHYRLTSDRSYWITFQTILYPNGDIQMQWNETGPFLTGGSATIGIQGDPTTALPYGRYSGALVENGRSIYYTYPGNPYRHWLRSEQRTAEIAGGASVAVSYTLQADYLLPGTYQGRVDLHSNDPDQPLSSIPVTLVVTDPAADGLALIRRQAGLVEEGGTVVLNESHLLADSPVAEPESILYTVSDSGFGALQLSGVPSTQFSQSDLNQGRLTYLHDGSDTSNSTVIAFTVTDGTESLGPFGLELTVIPVNDPPELSGPPEFLAANGITESLTGMTIHDPDISAAYANWYLNLRVDHGTIYLKPMTGGVYNGGPGSIQNNNTASVTVETWLSRLQTNFNTPGGVQYTPTPGYSGPDTLRITIEDNGNTGYGLEGKATLEIPITVYGSDYLRWQNEHFTALELGDPELEMARWGDSADPDGDTYANIFEYLLMSDPLSAEAQPVYLSGFDGVHLWLRFNLRKPSPGINWWGEWSHSIHGDWSTQGILTNTLKESLDHDEMEVRIPGVDPDSLFLRLQVDP